MGKGLVDELKKEFDIEDEWVSYEIHPETPIEGMLFTEKFKGANIEAMKEQLNRAGKPYGVAFGKMEIIANSQKSLEASEFAREQGKFHEFHEKVFYKYFTESKDIGNTDVLLEIAKDLGLDQEKLVRALEEGTYVVKLKEAHDEAQQIGVTATPTFIINDKYRIVGAQPLENFKRALRQIESQG